MSTAPARQFVFTRYVREAVTVGNVIALILAVGLTVVGVIDAAADPSGDRIWGNGMLIGPSIVVGYSTVQLIWKGGDDLLPRWGARVFGLNAIATVACTAAFAVAYPLTPVTLSANGSQFWLSEGWDTIVFPSLLGFAFALLAALAGMVFIVVPYLAIMGSRRLAAANMLDTDPRFADRNRAAGVLFAVVLMLAFLIPILIVVDDGASSTIGVVLIPVGIVLAIIVAVTQKTDRARRRQVRRASSAVDIVQDAMDERRNTQSR